MRSSSIHRNTGIRTTILSGVVQRNVGRVRPGVGDSFVGRTPVRTYASPSNSPADHSVFTPSRFRKIISVAKSAWQQVAMSGFGVTVTTVGIIKPIMDVQGDVASLMEGSGITILAGSCVVGPVLVAWGLVWATLKVPQSRAILWRSILPILVGLGFGSAAVAIPIVIKGIMGFDLIDAFKAEPWIACANVACVVVSATLLALGFRKANFKN